MSRSANASSEEPFDALVPAPFGGVGLRLAATGEVRELILMPGRHTTILTATSQAETAALAVAAYLENAHTPLDIPFILHGSPFRLRVWHAMRQIPPGSVASYSELAHQLGSSPRAVGGACGRNPIPLIVPCHRVVSAQGLGGFAGHRTGEWPELKRWLLRHEGVSDSRL